jgi:uncharacterized protein (TIGR03435 family)
MPDANEMELLRDYSRHGSEAAFAELVQRHISLVYSVALRHVGIAAHAEEITQAVFIILARKAGRLRPDTILEGWLHETARLIARSFLRGERRRQFREQEAYMQSTLNEPAAGDAVWQQLAPLLDEALSRLGKTDRDAVILRFFKEKSVREVAAALQTSEAAAQRRVLRALEKLHRFFTQCGISSTTAIIAGVIAANSVQAAPVALAKSVTAVAITKGAAASVSTLTLIKGALKIMAWTKVKTTAVVAIAALLAAGTTTVIVKETISPSISDDDPVWEMNPDSLVKAPPMVLVRPTHFHDARGRAARSTNGFVGGRFMGLQPIMASAYSWPFTRMVLPSNMPDGQFDYLITVRDHSKERFQAEIKKRLGWVGRKEIRETGVFLLKVKTPGASGITVNDGTPLWTAKNPPRSWIDIHNAPISALAGNLEGFFAKPVFDQTGLTNHYDSNTEWTQTGNYQTDSKSLQKALFDQLGLELVPTNMPIEMLVVEKAQ